MPHYTDPITKTTDIKKLLNDEFQTKSQEDEALKSPLDKKLDGVWSQFRSLQMSEVRQKKTLKFLQKQCENELAGIDTSDSESKSSASETESGFNGCQKRQSHAQEPSESFQVGEWTGIILGKVLNIPFLFEMHNACSLIDSHYVPKT